jgi:hypothetical protein
MPFINAQSLSIIMTGEIMGPGPQHNCGAATALTSQLIPRAIMIEDNPEELMRKAERYKRLAILMTDAQAAKALVEMAFEYNVRAEQLIKAASLREAERDTNPG